MIAISEERLNAYRQDGVNEITTVSRYLWNMAICESLYSPIQAAEVALRNAAHVAFTRHFGSDTWYDTKIPLGFGSEQVSEVKQKITKAGKKLTSGRVVAELSFGFWTSFFNKSYSNTELGACLLKNAFVNCQKYLRTREIQSKRWEQIRVLRNRIFHHERIIHWKNLADQHGRLIEAIGWVSPEMQELSLRLDRFLETYKAGIDPWKEKISLHWPRSSGS